jgi:hypothetical protein
MTIADAINTGLLVAAVLGIALTFWQVRGGVRTQRAQFLKDLYSTLAADPDVLAAYYWIEYGRFEYGAEFHGSEIEPKVDRLLAFVDLVAELYLQSIISEREMAFFRYRFRRIYEDVGIQEYLKFLASFYEQVRIQKEPYHSFQSVARRLAAET